MQRPDLSEFIKPSPQGVASALVLLAALALAAAPLAFEQPKGGAVVTLNVTLGALVAVLAYFRAMLAYRQSLVSWLMVALGLLALTLPWTMQFPATGTLRTATLALSGIIVLLGAASAVLPGPKS